MAIFMLPNSPTPLYVYWQQQMAFSAGMLTVMFALYITGLPGTLLLVGQLSDHYGKPVLLPGLFAALVAYGPVASATSTAWCAFTRIYYWINVTNRMAAIGRFLAVKPGQMSNLTFRTSST